MKSNKSKGKTATKSTTKKSSVSISVAKSDDGTIQLTYTIPYSDIKKTQNIVLDEAVQDIEVPGFRKGKAPRNKVAEKLDKNTLTEKTLQKILPTLFLESVKSEKINPATYPKFEVIKATENEPWEVRATTCELPKIDLTGYKDKLTRVAKTQTIWTPEKGKDDKKEPTKEEKEQIAIKALLGTIKVDIPKILVEEEVNAKLSGLLERIEKLGLTLESYLASIGKTAESLRGEYEKQAKETISLELILNEIARKENLEPDKKKVEELMLATKKQVETSAEEYNPEQQKIIIENSLRKRAALDYVASLL